MSEDILIPRYLAFAFLFPGRPRIEKKSVLEFNNAVSKARIDVPEIRISEQEAVFANRRDGGSGQIFQIQVGHYQSHFRLLITDSEPSTGLDCFAQQADLAWEAFQSIWTSATRLIFAEATLRYIAPVREPSAMSFLAQQMGLDKERLGKLSRPLELLGVRLGLPVAYAPRQPIALRGAGVNIRIENLLEDPKKLFFELTATWPALPLPEIPDQPDLPREINAMPQKPSAYLTEISQFLMKQVCSFTGLG